MEIERKWLVTGWPENIPVIAHQHMSQGYINVRPTVRIRKEVLLNDDGSDITDYILCIKSGFGIAREEVEVSIPEEKFSDLERVIGLPLIEKERRTYLLSDGYHLEVNHVDEGLPTEFWYAEIEYPSVEAARSWTPPSELETFLGRDVSEEPGQSMGEYWEITRLGNAAAKQ